jgi:hypothetical protein
MSCSFSIPFALVPGSTAEPETEYSAALVWCQRLFSGQRIFSFGQRKPIKAVKGEAFFSALPSFG